MAQVVSINTYFNVSQATHCPHAERALFAAIPRAADAQAGCQFAGDFNGLWCRADLTWPAPSVAGSAAVQGSGLNGHAEYSQWAYMPM